MKREDFFLKKIKKAFSLCNEAQSILNKVVAEVAKEKGFKNYHLFECSFATGNETVVAFNQDFESADLDLREMIFMSYDEIIERFSSWYLKYNEDSMNLLKEKEGGEK